MHSFHFWCFNDERDVGKAGIVEDIRECCGSDISPHRCVRAGPPGSDTSIWHR